MWIHLKRIAKRNANFIFFTTTKFGNELINSNPKWFRYDLVYEKKNSVGFLQSQKMQLRNHEMIYIFYEQDYDDIDLERNGYLREYFKLVKKHINKNMTEIIKDCGHGVVRSVSKNSSSQFNIPSEENYNKLIEKYEINKMLCFINYDNIKSVYEHPKKNTYNAQMTSGKPYKSKHKDETTKLTNYQSKSTASENLNGDRYPTSVLKFDYDKDQIYPTQKPVNLCEYLIKTYSNENDIVLDFCAGSGSSIIACINSNRKYIGIEKDKDIFDIAKKRINKKLFKEINM